MNFADAVQSTPEIAECLRRGLQALGSNSNKVEVRVTRDLKGSVDMDSCLTKLYPNAPRWDYIFGYREQVYYEDLENRSTYHWVASGRVDSEFAKDDKYRRKLLKNRILGPDSLLKVDTVL